MTCEGVTLADGTRAIVCSSRRPARCACGRRATLQCDWKVTERRSGTCDVDLCDRCAISPAPGKDLCPDHAVIYDQWRHARAGTQTSARIPS